MNDEEENRPRTYEKISEDTKGRMIAYIERNPEIPLSQVAQIFNVKARTLRNIYNKFRTTGTVSSERRGGAHNVKINQAHSDFIHMLLDGDPTITLRQIRARIFGQFGLTVTEKTVEKSIKK